MAERINFSSFNAFGHFEDILCIILIGFLLTISLCSWLVQDVVTKIEYHCKRSSKKYVDRTTK